MSLSFWTNWIEWASHPSANITIKNISKVNRTLMVGRPTDSQYAFTMQDSTGKELPELSPEFKEVELWEKTFPTVRPGEELKFTLFFVWERFDYGNGGTFTLRAQRKVPKLDGSGDIILRSNEETITIGANPRASQDAARRWGERVDGWVMSLRFMTNVYETALGITADIAIKNVQRKNLKRTLQFFWGFEIYFTMKDSTGKELLELPYQTEIRNRYKLKLPYAGRPSWTLKPGGILHELPLTDIGQRFDLSRGGTFTIQAHRRLLEGDCPGDHILHSNEETITIGPERKEGK